MGFVTDERLLDEKHKVSDNFDFTFVTQKLDRLIDIAPDKSLICLFGPYGSGKSTALHQIRKRKEDDTVFWFEFDAWKYPDRKDLWENFVLELAREFDDSTFRKVEAEIDGQKNADKKALVNTVVGSIPGAGGVKDGIKHFLKSSPATRTYQVQKILTDFLKDKFSHKQLIIIAEDIDRSGEAGIFFLETLKAYISDLSEVVGIKCIVPVAVEKYDVDVYLKCADIIEFFRPPVPTLESFLDNVLDSKHFTPLAKKQTAYFCERLFGFYNTQMSPRKLKHILRLGNTKFESMERDGLKPDGRMAIAIEATKLLKAQSNSGEKLFLNFLGQRRFPDAPFKELFNAIVFNVDQSNHRVTETRANYSINNNSSKPVGTETTCIPWQSPSTGPKIEGQVHEFYFHY